MSIIHVMELTDEKGTFCNVYQESPDGSANYDNLEAAAWAIVADSIKTGVAYTVTVHVADGEAGEHEFTRFTRAQAEARQYWERAQRIARAPRDPLTGRPLFVSY